MQTASESLNRMLGGESLEQEANSILSSAGFSDLADYETESEPEDMNPHVLVTILRARQRAIQQGQENARVKRSLIFIGAESFYFDDSEHHYVTVFEPFRTAYERAQRKANLEAIAELSTMIDEAENLAADFDAEQDIKALFATN
jgi:hypothetical protein